MLCEHGDLWQIEMLITDTVERGVKSLLWCCFRNLRNSKKSGDVERKAPVFTLCALKFCVTSDQVTFKIKIYNLKLANRLILFFSFYIEKLYNTFRQTEELHKILRWKWSTVKFIDYSMKHSILVSVCVDLNPKLPETITYFSCILTQNKETWWIAVKKKVFEKWDNPVIKGGNT